MNACVSSSTACLSRQRSSFSAILQLQKLSCSLFLSLLLLSLLWQGLRVRGGLGVRFQRSSPWRRNRRRRRTTTTTTLIRTIWERTRRITTTTTTTLVLLSVVVIWCCSRAQNAEARAFWFRNPEGNGRRRRGKRNERCIQTRTIATGMVTIQTTTKWRKEAMV